MRYAYTGEYELTYPDIIIPGEGSLVAHPGDERELDEAPDSRWIEVAEATPAPAPIATPFLAED